MSGLRDYKDRDCFLDSDGNRWVIHYSAYPKDGGYDEVIQLKKNNIEQGHVTYHYDRKGGTLLKRNDHGNINMPSNMKRC